MKSYFKMSDVFGGCVISNIFREIKCEGDVVVAVAKTGSAAQAIAHAINSHDELVRANKELLIHLERCAKELTSMINRHNKQSMEDGSWLYDQQTPYEAMWLIDRLNGIKLPAKDTINCDLYVAGGEA